MNALSALVVLAGYLAFWAALLSGQRLWLDAQDARVRDALNASDARVQCALSDALAQSGAVVLLGLERPVCGPVDSWRPEVVRRVA